jgi:protein-S-isoprenylcysteine O-methyltransferase Ste14
MAKLDYAIYLVHGGFWASFGIAHVVSSKRGEPAPSDDAAPIAGRETTARFSRVLVASHAIAFALIYIGVGSAVIPDRVPQWFPAQRLVGLIVIAIGAALASWARVWFHSWRFRAKLDAGHQLATGGPFRLMRHPIYMALNLFALGTAIWVPTIITWLAVVAMAIGSDLRGRAEEKVLADAFGQRYLDYSSRTKRFLPGFY